MLKRIFSIISSIIFLGLVVVGYIFLSQNKDLQHDVFKAIPSDAAVILETQEFGSFVQETLYNNDIWNSLGEFPQGNKLNQSLYLLDSLLNENSAIKSAVNSKPFAVSLHVQGKDQLAYQFYISLKNKAEERQLLAQIDQLVSEKKDYSGTPMYRINQNTQALHLAVKNSLVLVGSSQIRVEESIRQLENLNEINLDKQLVKVRETAGKNVDFNVYFNYQELVRSFSPFLSGINSSLPSLVKGIDNWTELDAHYKRNVFTLNGFTFLNNNTSSLYQLFNQQTAVEFDMENVLPGNTLQFKWLGISNYSKFEQNLQSFWKEMSWLHYADLQTKQIQETGFDIDNWLQTYMNDQIAFANLGQKSKPADDDNFVVVKTKTSDDATNAINEYLQKFAAANNKSIDEYKVNYEIDDETGWVFYKTEHKDFWLPAFGHFAHNYRANYIFAIDNFIATSNNLKTAQEIVRNYMLQKVLRTSLDYQDFTEYSTSESNYYYYSSPTYTSKRIIQQIHSKKLKDENKLEQFIKKFPSFTFQFSINDNRVFHNISLKYSPQIKERPRTIWESKLDDKVATKPAFVINHYTKDKEIFIQDMSNNVYLVNSEGRILWKVRLDERLTSEIYQVDFYKNGKFQLLFSTENKIHLLDRNGNYVERYPVTLREKASNGIALFDYDNNRDYRMFIATQNKKVYAYNIEGDIIKGWNFDKAEFVVNNEIQHFRVGSKDYIVFADKYKAYILNRRGDTRVTPKTYFSRSVNNSFILDINDRTQPRIVSTDTAGVVYFTYFTGEVESLKFHDYSARHFFDYQDVDADGQKDFIFVDENKIEVYNRSKKKIFDHTFDHTINHKPIYFYFSSADRKIGIVSNEENMIYLFNKNGDIYDGFPLQGSTLFSIGFLNNSASRFNLIVGNDDNFLYNYIVR